MCSLSKKYLICIPCEHKPFWQLSQLDDFAIRKNANLFFIHEKMNNLLPRCFYALLGKEFLRRKKSEKLRDEVLQMFVEMLWEKHSALPEKNI